MEIIQEKNYGSEFGIRATRCNSDNVFDHIGRHLEIMKRQSQFRGDTKEDLETGLRGYLNGKFGRIVGKCRISAASDTRFDILLEPEPNLTLEVSGLTRLIVKHAVNEFFNLIGLKLRQVHWAASTSQTPSLIVLLAAIKATAPADLDSIRQALRERDYPLDDEDWLRKKLDLLRKRDLLVRRHDGRYALTEQALASLSVRTSRASSDVTRALALGRRNWVD